MLKAKIWTVVKMVVFFLISNMIAAFMLGLVSGIANVAGGNIVFTGVREVNFNPLITIAYLMIFYFLLMFHKPQADKQYGLFLLTLFVSFTVNFLQGSILLVIFFYFGSKLRLF
jgi:hypothetical protein